MKHSTIFKNRWWALLWAAGIIWFALDVAEPSATTSNLSSNDAGQTDATGAPVTTEDAQKIADIVGNI